MRNDNNTPMADTPVPTPAKASNHKRTKALKALSVVVLIGLAWGAYVWYEDQHY